MKLSLSLPIADRRTSHDFYAALGFEAFGEPASDGLPEPLQFAVNEGASLLLIPRGGFGWVIGERAVAEPGTCECILSVDGDVDALFACAREAGAEIVAEPEQQPWGYTGTFADPDGHLWMVVA
jgi:predicted lactoylglutathione lyase